MNSILPFIITGLTSGAVYALGGVGLVLTYKTSRIFNFAFGAIATVGAYVYYALHVRSGVPTSAAIIVSVLGVGIALGLVFESFARALSRTTLPLQVGATVGILVFVQAFFTVIYGSETLIFPQFLPQHTFEFFGTYVGLDQIITVGLAAAATAVLYAFFRTARLGVAMRGVVDDPELLALTGTPPNRVRRWAWIIGCVFAAACGLLLAPKVNLSANTLTLLIVQAFGAAAIGAFRSLPLTFFGGLLIGVVSSLATKYVATAGVILTGVPPSVPFLTLFVVMLVIPRRWLAAPQRVVPLRASWSAPAPLQFVGGAALLVVLAFAPSFASSHLTEWTVMLCYVILFLSLGLLVRTSGQVSLSQLSFMAIGAAAFSHLSIGAGLPWLLALIGAGLVAVPIGMLLAIPAIRLGGLYLALATFGFGIALQQMFYASPSLMFGTAGAEEPRPSLSWLTINTDKGFYYVVLLIAVLATAAVIVLTRSRLGRLLRAMSDSPLALTTNGTSVNVMRVLVFSISAFLAAVAGALLGATTELATGALFDPFASLTLIALILIVVGREPWYAIMAAAGLTLVPAYISGGNVSYYLEMFFGASAVLVAVFGIPQLSPRILAVIDRYGGASWRFGKRTVAPPAGAGEAPARVAEGAIDVRDLTVRFGGLVAVDGFSLTAPTGRITGLIGPNGAGKTTTFNACSGLLRPTSGRILMDGRDVTKMSPAHRAQLGLGRTFQKMELFDASTVSENVALGCEASMAGRNPIAQVFSRPIQRRRVQHRVTEALELCGIAELGDARAGTLSTGQRRLVELARCLAGPFRVLLLDEPSSGLDRRESERFGEILQHVVQSRGVAILLVEHDMALVMRICEHIYVLDFGEPLFDGSPAEVSESPVVQAAYLGQSEGLVVEQAT